ncbi:hypothetical protein AB0I28_12440 [Phytomonospora sp. NPDC050363]|uniref:hypothetical protein n=1 Tax=Phytomonospora sp. NPDC050363 TaxID=3155642 RepID=UPI0033C7781E
MQTVLDGLDTVPATEGAPEVSLRELLRVLHRQGVVLSRIRHAIPPHHVAGWSASGDGWYGHVWQLSELFRPELRWQVFLSRMGGTFDHPAKRLGFQRHVTVGTVIEGLREVGFQSAGAARYTQDGEGNGAT